MSATESLDPLMTLARRAAGTAMIAGLAVFTVACGETPDPEPMDDMPAETGEPAPDAMDESNTVLDVAAADGNFSTLLAAISAAGLTETLESDGPFTVFAPTDEAFDNLPEGTLEELLGDPDALAEILLFHVVPGMVMSDEVVGSDQLESAEGSYLQITADDDMVMIEGAHIINVDIEADNGVIHVIDAVMLPGS